MSEAPPAASAPDPATPAALRDVDYRFEIPEDLAENFRVLYERVATLIRENLALLPVVDFDPDKNRFKYFDLPSLKEQGIGCRFLFVHQDDGSIRFSWDSCEWGTDNLVETLKNPGCAVSLKKFFVVLCKVEVAVRIYLERQKTVTDTLLGQLQLAIRIAAMGALDPDKLQEINTILDRQAEAEAK